MPNATDIVGYTYKANLYCPECILGQFSPTHWSALGDAMGVEETLDMLARFHIVNRNDESAFDSGDFPKVVFRDMIDGHMGFGKLYDDNAPLERCGSCGKVLGS